MGGGGDVPQIICEVQQKAGGAGAGEGGAGALAICWASTRFIGGGLEGGSRAEQGEVSGPRVGKGRGAEEEPAHRPSLLRQMCDGSRLGEGKAIVITSPCPYPSLPFTSSTASDTTLAPYRQ